MEPPHLRPYQCLWPFVHIMIFYKIHDFLQVILTQQHETPDYPLSTVHAQHNSTSFLAINENKNSRTQQ